MNRIVLGGLLAFGALNAFGGGVYGLSGAPAVPLEWLHGSPFHDYFVPSLFLLVVIGGTLTIASIAVFTRARTGRLAAFAAAALLVAWIGVQVAIIGYTSWMQPVTVGAALVIAALASRLRA
jgi:hypothetical protein